MAINRRNSPSEGFGIGLVVVVCCVCMLLVGNTEQRGRNSA